MQHTSKFLFEASFKYLSMLSFWYFPAQSSPIILAEGLPVSVLGLFPNPGPFIWNLTESWLRVCVNSFE